MIYPNDIFAVFLYTLWRSEYTKKNYIHEVIGRDAEMFSRVTPIMESRVFSRSFHSSFFLFFFLVQQLELLALEQIVLHALMTEST